MITISVLPIMNGKDYPSAGESLYVVIMQNVQNQDKIVLDMSGVSMLPSMFLNTSLGRIITEQGAPYVKEKISFSNIKASDAQRLTDYIRRFA